MNDSDHGHVVPMKGFRRAACCAAITALLTAGCAVEVDTAEVDGPASGLPSGEIVPDSTTVDVLGQAFAQEQFAQKTYDHIIAEFGPVAPFGEIAREHAANVSAVKALAREHHVFMGEVQIEGDVPDAPTIATECSIAGGIEQTGIDMYDELLPRVRGDAETTKLLASLRSRARNSYLPAFRQCAA